MRYADIRDFDISNGENIGISLFVQGCHFHCPNCFNKETWDFNGGQEWNYKTEERFIDLAKRDYIKRISILGGEPLADENVNDILLLIINIRDTFYNSKKIWLYTGYKYEDIVASYIRFNIIKRCDVLVDGLFIDSLKDMRLKWKGSSNQRVIDIKETINNNRMILYTD